MRLRDQRIDPLHREAGVVAAEMGDGRAAGRLVLEHRRHHAAIIAGRRGKVGADLRHAPRDRPAIAISGDEHRALPLQGVDAALRILQALLERMERSEEHTSELQSLMRISYAVFCLKKKIHSTYST